MYSDYLSLNLGVILIIGFAAVFFICLIVIANKKEINKLTDDITHRDNLLRYQEKEINKIISLEQSLEFSNAKLDQTVSEYELRLDILRSKISDLQSNIDSRESKAILHQWISDTCNKAISLCESSVFPFDWDGDPDCLRLYHALDEKIVPNAGIRVKANFASNHDNSIYVTTLNSCTCPDFRYHTNGQPCKHMYALALQLGIFLVPDRVNLHALLHDYAEQKSKLDQEKKDILRIVNTRSQRSPWLAEQLAQYKYERELAMIDSIPRLTKKEAIKMMELAAQKKSLEKERKELEYQLKYLILRFPYLDDFITSRPSKDITATSEEMQSALKEDPEWEVISDYLSDEEYIKLPNVEKYQLALDRYEKHSHSAFDAGIRFERFVGYSYEQNGYAVQYRGALDGKDDLGRDIIASKNDKTYIIQCKRWKEEWEPGKPKVIHENYIFQLYGTTILYQIDHPNTEAIPVFVTTTTLSDRAAAFASELNIVVYSNVKMLPYPKIKCNIGKNGEKIYHLPFDQQYDKTVITPKTGERYCTTVAEAESYGFRRAKKWLSSQTPTK